MNNTTDLILSPYEIPSYIFNDPSVLTIFKALGLGLLILLTIFGNLLVIVAVLPSPTLRTPTHSLIVNLAVADLLLGITVLPLSAAQELHDGAWLFGPNLCSAWKTLDVLCCTASILSLCGISIDRYIGVSRPLAYSRIITKRRARILIAAIWALAIAISIAPPLGWQDDEEEMHIVSESQCQVNKQLGYVIFSACGSFYIPALVTSVLYFLVYRAASRYSKFLSSGSRVTSRDVTLRVHMGNSHSCGRSSICDGQPIHKLSSASCGSAATLLMASTNGLNHVGGQHLQQQPHDPLAVPTGHRYSGDSCGTTSTTPTSEGWSVACEQGRRLTAAGVYGRAAKFRRQKKAAKTLGIVVGFFLLCWLPFFLILPIDAACPNCDLSIPFNLAFWLGYLNSCINPFIYACSSRDLRRAFRSILCLRRYRGTNRTNGCGSIGSRRHDTATSRRPSTSAYSTSTASMRGCASTISTTMNTPPCNHTLCTVVPGSRSTSVSISLLRRTPSPR